MPKVVDRDTRRDDIARAVWRVLDARGMSELSIRTVASEASMPPSTLQHYFDSREELLSHALQLAIREQGTRIGTHDSTVGAFEQVKEMWCHTLPLNAVQRTEANVWFSAIVSLRGDTHRKVLDDAEAGLDHLATWSVTALTGEAHPDEAIRLRAFMDGLAVNALSRPDRFPADELRRHVTQYLADLSDRTASPGALNRSSALTSTPAQHGVGS